MPDKTCEPDFTPAVYPIQIGGRRSDGLSLSFNRFMNKLQMEFQFLFLKNIHTHLMDKILSLIRSCTQSAQE